MAKGKAVKAAIKNPKVRRALDKIGLGGAAVAVGKAADHPAVQAAEGAALGFAVGGPLGAVGGGLMGYILADQVYVVPVPMIAIPAFEAYRIQGTPSSQIYIRAGETIMPTGGNVQDVVEVEENLEAALTTPHVKKSKTAYQKRYSKAFDKVKNKHKLKNGKWKKNGFKRAVKEAHAMAKK